MRPDQLANVGHPEADAIVALTGTDDGKFLAVGQDELEDQFYKLYGDLIEKLFPFLKNAEAVLV